MIISNNDYLYLNDSDAVSGPFPLSVFPTKLPPGMLSFRSAALQIYRPSSHTVLMLLYISGYR